MDNNWTAYQKASEEFFGCPYYAGLVGVEDDDEYIDQDNQRNTMAELTKLYENGRVRDPSR